METGRRKKTKEPSTTATTRATTRLTMSQFLSMGSDSEGSAMEGRRSARRLWHNYAEAGDEEDDEQDEEEMAASAAIVSRV